MFITNTKFEILWARYVHPDNGDFDDQKCCKERLELEKPYRVIRFYEMVKEDFIKKVVYVRLEGVYGCLFNSEMFDFENYKFQKISKETAFNDIRYKDYWYKAII